MEKTKESTLTLKLSKDDVALIERAKQNSGEKTATKAIIESLKMFNEVVDELQATKARLKETERDKEIVQHVRAILKLMEY